MAHLKMSSMCCTAIMIFAFVLIISTISLIVFITVYSFVSTTIEKKIDQPHIIVIMTDDMGWNDVSFHGSNQIPTPNIDALAYNGVILKNHYVLPTCTPSRTAFLTGRYPIREGMQGFPLRAGEPRGIPLTTKLLPEHLKKLGYDTRLIGKWHLGYYKDEFTPTRRGFDTFYGYYNGYITYFNHTITESNQTGYDMHRDNPTDIKPDQSHSNEYVTDVFTNEAINIISNHDNKRPLYLQISHLAPHSSDAVETLETRDLGEVNKTFDYIKDISRRKFAGMMSALDESVGRVMKALNEKKLLKNSIIIFMADNGAQTIGLHENHGSNHPLRGLKFTHYEGGVHGVACVYSPLINKKERIVNDLIHMTDWLPTLYTIAGGKIQDLGIVDGVNQWQTISWGKSDKRNSLLVNIDEIEKLESAIKIIKKGEHNQRYKLLKGAGSLYDGYFPLMDSYVPEYNTTAVLTSLSGQAISKSTSRLINKDKMLALREKSRIVCNRSNLFSAVANCSNHCLFNIDQDPCETTDISNNEPEIVRELEKYIDGYRNVLMNQTNQPVDPRSLPNNSHSFWMPWLNLNSFDTETNKKI